MQNSPARAVIDVGSVIADTYTIEALIGRGGMGAVFLASHKRLPGKKVAVKMLHAELAGDEVLARFRREAEIATRLDHPNIVQVHDFNVLPDGTPYLILELLQGETLAQRLRQGPLPIEQVVSIARQVGSALAAAHREGIVHRDLKPQNIFLVPTEIDGRMTEIAKVLDFGISKIRGSQTVKTQDSALLGTPQYMAPEQALGQHANVDERTDVFALGAIVYEMLTGQPAFVGASIPEVVFKVVYEQPVPLEQAAPTVTPQVLAAVQQAMQKQADARFPNVSAFVEALTGQPLSLRPGSLNLPAPDSGPGTGARARTGPHTGNDAFAQTMGSGDHGASPISGMEATATPASLNRQQAGLPISPTVAPAPVGGATVASESGRAQTPLPVPPHRKPIGVIVGAVLVCAAFGAIALYFAMRGHGSRQVTPPVAVNEMPPVVGPGSASLPVPPSKPPVQPPTPEKLATNPPTSETPAKHDPVAKTDPKDPKDSKDSKDSKHPPAHTEPTKTPGDDEDEKGGDADAREKLQSAELAMRGGQYARAEQLANSVINSPTSTQLQQVRARGIRGVVRCLQHNDEEGAHNNLRGIPPRYAKIRRRVIEACHSVGLLQAL